MEYRWPHAPLRIIRNPSCFFGNAKAVGIHLSVVVGIEVSRHGVGPWLEIVELHFGDAVDFWGGREAAGLVIRQKETNSRDIYLRHSHNSSEHGADSSGKRHGQCPPEQHTDRTSLHVGATHLCGYSSQNR